MLFHPDDTRILAIFEGNDISPFYEFKAIIATEGSVININSSLLSN